MHCDGYGIVIAVVGALHSDSARSQLSKSKSADSRTLLAFGCENAKDFDHSSPFSRMAEARTRGGHDRRPHGLGCGALWETHPRLVRCLVDFTVSVDGFLCSNLAQRPR